MCAGTAVTISNDFAPRKTSIAHGTTDDKLASAVDVAFSPLIQQFARNGPFNHLLYKVVLNDIALHPGVMMGSQDNRDHSLGYSTAILYGYLRLAIRSQIRYGLVLSHLS